MNRLALAFALTALLALRTLPAQALTESQQDAAISNLQSTVAAQQTTINALVAKLQYVTVSGHDLTLTGNLHVVSGAGSTSAKPNGLGNVIIGYNEARTGSGAVNTRTGSHCLILGNQNNYTSYGGIVAGNDNTLSGAYASIPGGRGNTASASFAAVSGGYGNTASSPYAAVGGGQGYAANATYAFLPTSASQSTIQSFQTQINSLQSTATSQGATLTKATAITNLFSLANGVGTKTELTLTGVNLHLVNGLGATNGEPNAPYDTSSPVVNGLGNLILGYNELRANDPNNPASDTRTGSHNLILGDENNFSSYSGIVLGLYNTVSAPFASVTDGTDNTASGDYALVSGGRDNAASASFASVSGGTDNTASGDYATVSGGYFNGADGTSASVSGGAGNTAGGEYASVSGGETNTAGGSYASVSGGAGNTAGGSYASVSGGRLLTQSTEFGWSAGSEASTAVSGNFTSP